uniref:UPAR/Ly6 domain-containing protein n=1 Tax=Monodon monoceros TaxID=40151 RepID=A0A8C6CD47_MONMO
QKMCIYLFPLSLCCILRGGQGRLRDPLSLRLPYSLAQIIEIIQCRMCHLQFPGEKCSRGRGICTATMEEACTTGRIFRNNGTPWLTFRGCLKNCANVNNIMEGLSGKLQVLQKT